jgi:hypothetical protein
MTLQTRRIQLYSNWTSKWLSDEGLEKVLLALDAEWSSYEEWQELMQSDRDYRKAFIFLADSYNYLGMMIKEDNEGLKYCTTSGRTFLYWWEKYRDIVYNERERRNDKTYCASWEYFHNNLVKYLKEHPELGL